MFVTPAQAGIQANAQSETVQYSIHHNHYTSHMMVVRCMMRDFGRRDVQKRRGRRSISLEESEENGKE